MTTDECDFTFGCELEFGIPGLLEGRPDPDPLERDGITRRPPAFIVPAHVTSDPITRKQKYGELMKDICDTVNAHVQKRHPNFDIRPVEREHPENPENGVKPTADDIASGRCRGEWTGDPPCFEVYKSWGIGIDGTGPRYPSDEPLNMKKRWQTVPYGPEDYVWFYFELRTSVYGSLADLGHVLGDVLASIKSNFRTYNNFGNEDNRTAVNHHVGSKRFGPGHVHRHELFFELKMIATLLWISDEALGQLHPSWRKMFARYSAKPRTQSNLAWLVNTPDFRLHRRHYIDKAEKPHDYRRPYWADPKRHLLQPSHWYEPEFEKWINKCIRNCQNDYDKKALMALWWNAMSAQDIAWLFASHFGNRRGAFSLHGLFEQQDTDLIHHTRKAAMHTIEWRYMEGSMDHSDIMNAWYVTEKIHQLSRSETEFKDVVDQLGRECGWNFDKLTPQHLLPCLKLGIHPRSQKELDDEAEPPEAWKGHLLPEDFDAAPSGRPKPPA